jgi:exopolysaccharide biosynthesis polyprenyl glycosylphosphotransferase
MEPATFASIPPKTESLRVFESEPALPPLGQLSVLDSSANESGRRVRGSRRAKVAVVLTDSVVVATSMLAAALICTALGTKPEDPRTLLIVSIIALPLWLGVFARYRLYQTAAVTSFTAEFSRIVHAVVAATVATALVEIAIAAPISRAWLLVLVSVALALVIIERAIVRMFFRHARARGQFKRRVVMIGTNAEALGVVEMLRDDPELGYDVVGLLDCDTAYGVVPPVPVLGQWHDAVHVMDDVDATGVIIAASAMDVPLANRLARQLMERGYHVEVTSGLVDIAANRLIARPLGRRAVMYVEPVRRFGWRRYAKRVFDVVIAAGMLVVLSPVLLAAAIAIKIDTRGPVFFRQRRVGKDGRDFGMLKFRSMVINAEELLSQVKAQSDSNSPLFKMQDDPRITRVGNFLRKTSIDELPQLFNVLRGEMSIVGPRPALPSETVAWSDDLRNRLRVKPGITGMWQVNGRSSASFDDYERYDLYYVDNWSLLADLSIIAKTVPVVLLRRGAY